MAQEEPTNYQFAGAGLGLSYVGDRCYAYSGAVDVNNVETDLINTTTQAGFIKGAFQFCYAGAESPNMRFRVKLNGLVIWDFEADHSQLLNRGTHPVLDVIIPPFTVVSCTGENTTDSQSLPLLVTFTGRVYGVE